MQRRKALLRYESRKMWRDVRCESEGRGFVKQIGSKVVDEVGEDVSERMVEEAIHGSCPRSSGSPPSHLHAEIQLRFS
jgi:hypothetical protein